jgi:putative ABC transport system permease protein
MGWNNMYLELAKRNIERAKTRSILAIVGIIIGVMAVASIGIFGNSMQKSVLESFEDVADTIVVTPKYSKGFVEIEEKDIELIKKVENTEYIIPVKDERSIISFKDERAYSTIYGIREDDLKKLYDVYDGNIKLKGTAVIGYTLAKDFGLRVGSRINIAGSEFRIAGILEEEGMSFAINPDNAVFLSVDDFDKLFNKGYTTVVVKAENLDYIDSIADNINDIVNRRDEKVEVMKLKSVLETIEESLSTMTRFLIAIAAISLLVAGVSILNIMLMSTIERTKEIGIMRAIGAYRETILKIFLMEALILGITGSIIGTILSVAGGFIIVSMMGLTTKYILDFSTAFYVVEGFAVGIFTAVASGLYPAWKASRLEPIEALKYE